MSIENNRERPRDPRTFDNCNNCKQDYDYTRNNCVIFVFKKDPTYNFLLTICPCIDPKTEEICASRWKIFTEHDMVTVARQLNPEVHVKDYAPVDLIESYNDFMGIELIESKELSPEEENRVGFLAYQFDQLKDTLSAEHFMEMVNPKSIVEHRLTPRQEKIAQFFGELIMNMVYDPVKGKLIDPIKNRIID